MLAFTQPAGSVPKPGGELGPTNIGGMTPNKPGLVFEPGVARLLRGNSDIVMQIHYTTNGTEAKDRTTIGVIYAKQPPTKMAAGGMAINPRFVIPAGDGNSEVRATTPINRDTLVTGFTPHMHVRGKDMTYIAHYPDGTDETLLSVPKYDFNWQITYELATPKLLPKGTKLEVIAHFDNSTAQQVQPGSDEGRALGRSDVGRDDDRLLLDRASRRRRRRLRLSSSRKYEVGSLKYERNPVLQTSILLDFSFLSSHSRLWLAAVDERLLDRRRLVDRPEEPLEIVLHLVARGLTRDRASPSISASISVRLARNGAAAASNSSVVRHGPRYRRSTHAAQAEPAVGGRVRRVHEARQVEIVRHARSACGPASGSAARCAASRSTCRCCRSCTRTASCA